MSPSRSQTGASAVISALVVSQSTFCEMRRTVRSSSLRSVRMVINSEPTSGRSVRSASSSSPNGVVSFTIGPSSRANVTAAPHAQRHDHRDRRDDEREQAGVPERAPGHRTDERYESQYRDGHRLAELQDV